MKRESFTFDGFEPANTTPVPDIVFDELLTKLTGAELKVLLYIIRRTWGFKKATDAISLNQLQYGIKTRDGKQLDNGCGITRRDTIVDATDSLLKKHCIIAEKQMAPQGDHATTVYGIYFKEVVTKPDYPTLVGSHQTGLPVVSKADYPWSPNRTRVVTIGDPQVTVLQDTVRQETDSQESITPTESKRESSAFAPHAFLLTEEECSFSEDDNPTEYRQPAIPKGATNGHHTPNHLQPDNAHSLDSVRSDEHASGNGVTDELSQLYTGLRACAGNDISLSGSDRGNRDRGKIPASPAERQIEQTPLPARSAPPDERTDGAATPTVDGSESRPSPEQSCVTINGKVTQEKPKRNRKKPVEVQLTLREAEIKEWYEELRGVEVSFSKKNVTALQALGKRTMTKDDFLNVTAILDTDKWFEEHKIGVDLYWIERQWDNKIIFLRRRKQAPLADKKPVGATPYNNLDLLFAQITTEGV